MMTTLPKLLDSDKAVLNTKHGESSKRVFTSIVIIEDFPTYMARRLARYGS